MESVTLKKSDLERFAKPRGNIVKRGSQGTRKRRPSRETAILFFRQSPKPSEWRKHQLNMGLYHVEDYEKMIQVLMGREDYSDARKLSTGVGDQSLKVLSTADALVDFTLRFARLTGLALASSHLQRNISNFQALVLLSLCIVLEWREVP